jgi:hypothetical protein
MKVQLILSELDKKRGQNIPCLWRRQLKVRKGVTNLVEKISECVVRAGINYKNLRAVQELRESAGEIDQPHPLTWGTWQKWPFIITHQGKEYLRVYPASLDIHAKVQYMLDGQQVAKEQIEHLCLSSEFKKQEEMPRCFTVRAENVIRLGNVIEVEEG